MPMTEKDRALVAAARKVRSDYGYISSLRDKADTEEARGILDGLEEEAFRVHERIAFEDYD